MRNLRYESYEVQAIIGMLLALATFALIVSILFAMFCRPANAGIPILFNQGSSNYENDDYQRQQQSYYNQQQIQNQQEMIKLQRQANEQQEREYRDQVDRQLLLPMINTYGAGH